MVWSRQPRRARAVQRRARVCYTDASLCFPVYVNTSNGEYRYASPHCGVTPRWDREDTLVAPLAVAARRTDGGAGCRCGDRSPRLSGSLVARPRCRVPACGGGYSSPASRTPPAPVRVADTVADGVRIPARPRRHVLRAAVPWLRRMRRWGNPVATWSLAPRYM